ncbi:MAG TPA: hypothetical protein VKT70_02695, partial [Stellaceae bacterium]|nr:hypothetical protein [Stellaceae bacterium]
GEITPDEAVSIARFLEGRARVLKAWKLEQSLTRWDQPLPIPGDDRPSPIPYPPPKEGWPSYDERLRLWGTPWPPPDSSPRPSEISSPPARGEKDAKGWRGKAEPYPKLDEGAASAREVEAKPGTSPSAGATHPHPAPAKRDDVALSLRNPLPQAGEGKSKSGESDAKSPPLFSPHLHALLEAAAADPADHRWLPVLDEEWGLKGRLALHLPCKLQAPAALAETQASPDRAPPLAAAKTAPPAPLAPAAPRPAPSPQAWVSATPMPRPQRRAEPPRVITQRPR